MLNLTELARGGNFCVAKATLAEGTNANTIKVTNSAGIDFAIDGVMYSKATTDNIAMDALAIQAVSTTCLYLVMINAAGTVSMKKGTEVATADLAAGSKVLQWPACDALKAPIGAIKIVTNSSATFTNGSTDLSASGITATFYDLLTVPSKPLSS